MPRMLLHIGPLAPERDEEGDGRVGAHAQARKRNLHLQYLAGGRV